MPELTGSVGKGGINKPHEVRLIELMLRVTKRKAGGPYFPDDNSGEYTGRLAEAIAEFQAAEIAKAGDAGASDRPGLIEAGSLTWRALVARLPDDLKEVRTSADISVPYLAMGQAALQESVGALRNPSNHLDPMFAHKLVTLVTEFHQKRGIVLSVQRWRGWWRNLDDQVNLVSQGGPGESIHHYGFAVDLGFRNWCWVHPDGRVHKPDRGDFFESTLDQAVKDELWEARNAIAFDKLKLYTTKMGGDRAHIQAFEDDPVDSASSWILLLEAYGPRKMKWEPYERTPTSYKCDLGLGGKRYLVGTAIDIWVLNPNDPRWAKDLKEKGLHPKLRLKKANLAKALNAKLAADKSFTLEGFFGAKKDAHAHGRPLKEADITDADLLAVRKLLHREFEEAAKHWQSWKAVYYPSKDRRPEHNRDLPQAPDPD